MSSMRRAFSDAFAFGRTSSVKTRSKVERSIGDCLPATDWPLYDQNGDIKGFNGWHVFGSETARNHFIKHALILLSENGRNDLGGLHFDNFFARSYDKTGVIWYTASIVVTAPGDYRIKHSVVATRAGTTKTAAFQLLMLDVETKLGFVLRGNGLNNAGLPAKHSKRKGSSTSVSIISTPSEAMAPPKLPIGSGYNITWSDLPLTTSPRSKASTPLSNASKSSRGTQESFGLSKYSQHSQSTQSSQSTAPSTQSGPVSAKASYQLSKSALTFPMDTPTDLQHARHASTPLQPATISTSPTPKTAKHVSQPLQPRSASTPPTTETTIKILPPLPLLPRSSMEKPRTTPHPGQVHPALRSKSNSTEGLKPSTQEQTPSLSGSSVYSRSPVSPMDDAQSAMQPLHVDPDMPSPLHFERRIAQLPARSLTRAQTEFEIYV